MTSFSSFIDHFLPLWRKYRLEDWKNPLASMLLTTGCILAAMSWKLGASWIFVVLYICLGTTGFLVKYLIVFQGMSGKQSETLPLLSPSRLKLVSTYQERKILNGKNSETSMSYGVNTNEIADPGSNFCSSDTSQNQSVSSSQIETGSGDIKVVKVINKPCLAQEVYVTGPLPGGNQSRQTEKDDHDQSELLPKLLLIADVFRCSPATVQSEQSHISSEVTDSPPGLESSNPEENPLVPQSTTWVYHQSIYKNIIPHPKRIQVFLEENDLITPLDYEDHSKELKTFVDKGGDDENFLPYGQKLPSSELIGKGGAPRLGDFISPKRACVNVVRPFNQDISQLLGKEQPESEQTVNYTPTTRLECSLRKKCTNSSSKDTESSKKYHLDEQGSSIINRDFQKIKPHNSLLQCESCYMNVSSLCKKTENQTDENSLKDNSLSKTGKASSPEAKEISISENVRMPSTLSRMNSTVGYETMLSNASSSCPDTMVKILNLLTSSVIPEKQATSKQFRVITNLEDEDSFCLLKGLGGGDKIPESEDSKITTTASESSGYKSRSSFSFTEQSRSLFDTDTGILNSKDLGNNIFPPIEHTRSFTKEMPPTSMVSCTSRRASFNTPLEIPRTKTFRSPEFRTTPLILPPLDKGYSSKTTRSSTSIEKIHIPVILNRSSTVQTELKKFSAQSQDSVQSVNHHASYTPTKKQFRHFQQSSRNSKSQIESLGTKFSIPSTTQSFERYCSLILPSKLNLPTRNSEESSRMSPISNTDLPLDTFKETSSSINFELSSKNSTSSTITPIQDSDSVTHSESTSTRESTSETSSKFFAMPKHTPVYF